MKVVSLLNEPKTQILSPSPGFDDGGEKEPRARQFETGFLFIRLSGARLARGVVWDARRYRYHGGVRVCARLRAGGPVTSCHYFEYL